ncbi:thioredoxin reductase [Paenibacillus shirakamiensis]|uniref:Thioredoxin reductase n=1 Tax=Paenibacillus shirakamiensis TaxID=1265935 RepID=A0ABS4JL47_9BACL|nr:NAD(P)/FAD-dependent oxidoreductase [Paenibacillus shirakamiensis]MBP2002430.1 thioredoxin reductase [Paenibacillus shirakamiensis]
MEAIAIQMLDALIIGGGPAGLNAALILGRARRTTVLLDDAHPRNEVTHASHGFITRDGIAPNEFRRLATDDLARYPSVHRRQEQATEMIRHTNSFEVHTHSGSIFHTKKLLMATGLREVLPEIKGIETYYGTSLFSCPYCDGWELRDQPLLVIGTTNQIFQMSKMVYHWSRHLIVCTMGHDSLDQYQRNALYRRNIRIIDQPIVGFSGQGRCLQRVHFGDGYSIERSGGFVIPQVFQHSRIGESLGCARSPAGGWVTDDYGRTSIWGVYAAGDTALIAPAQLVIAAADGCRAGMGIHMDLLQEEF